MNPTTLQLVGAVLFALAVLHTFSTKFFEQLAHRQPSHSGLWHLMSEVEVVFGFWAIVLIVFMMLLDGYGNAISYVDSRNYTEPLFVFAIMVVAGSRPILHLASLAVKQVARCLPLTENLAIYFTVLAVVPLLGSFITEPAAMTLAALMLRSIYYSQGLSSKLQYVTLGVLFVNVSIGGTLTSFGAPPVLMVASTWGWDSWFMLTHFGWKSALAVFINAAVATLVFREELLRLKVRSSEQESGPQLPLTILLVHLLLLVLIVLFSHHPPMFLGCFLLFMGVATAYPQYQERLILREGLLVAFFLAGLVVLGGLQAWWLQPLMARMDATTVYFGATALTAITDNAALTYLASLVDGLSDEFKYAVVSGAVTGGGLTVIANAPNPAGMAILRGHFNDGVVNPLGLLLAALPPTLVAILAFQLL